jgi:hypothetical protein
MSEIEPGLSVERNLNYFLSSQLVQISVASEGLFSLANVKPDFYQDMLQVNSLFFTFSLSDEIVQTLFSGCTVHINCIYVLIHCTLFLSRNISSCIGRYFGLIGFSSTRIEVVTMQYLNLVKIFPSFTYVERMTDVVISLAKFGNESDYRFTAEFSLSLTAQNVATNYLEPFIRALKTIAFVSCDTEKGKGGYSLNLFPIYCKFQFLYGNKYWYGFERAFDALLLNKRPPITQFAHTYISVCRANTFSAYEVIDSSSEFLMSSKRKNSKFSFSSLLVKIRHIGVSHPDLMYILIAFTSVFNLFCRESIFHFGSIDMGAISGSPFPKLMVSHVSRLTNFGLSLMNLALVREHRTKGGGKRSRRINVLKNCIIWQMSVNSSSISHYRKFGSDVIVGLRSIWSHTIARLPGCAMEEGEIAECEIELIQYDLDCLKRLVYIDYRFLSGNMGFIDPGNSLRTLRIIDQFKRPKKEPINRSNATGCSEGINLRRVLYACAKIIKKYEGVDGNPARCKAALRDFLLSMIRLFNGLSCLNLFFDIILYSSTTSCFFDAFSADFSLVEALYDSLRREEAALQTRQLWLCCTSVVECRTAVKTRALILDTIFSARKLSHDVKICEILHESLQLMGADENTLAVGIGMASNTLCALAKTISVLEFSIDLEGIYDIILHFIDRLQHPVSMLGKDRNDGRNIPPMKKDEHFNLSVSLIFFATSSLIFEHSSKFTMHKKNMEMHRNKLLFSHFHGIVGFATVPQYLTNMIFQNAPVWGCDSPRNEANLTSLVKNVFNSEKTVSIILPSSLEALPDLKNNDLFDEVIVIKSSIPSRIMDQENILGVRNLSFFVPLEFSQSSLIDYVTLLYNQSEIRIKKSLEIVKAITVASILLNSTEAEVPLSALRFIWMILMEEATVLNCCSNVRVYCLKYSRTIMLTARLLRLKLASNFYIAYDLPERTFIPSIWLPKMGTIYKRCLGTSITSMHIPKTYVYNSLTSVSVALRSRAITSFRFDICLRLADSALSNYPNRNLIAWQSLLSICVDLLNVKFSCVKTALNCTFFFTRPLLTLKVGNKLFYDSIERTWCNILSPQNAFLSLGVVNKVQYFEDVDTKVSDIVKRYLCNHQYQKGFISSRISFCTLDQEAIIVSSMRGSLTDSNFTLIALSAQKGVGHWKYIYFKNAIAFVYYLLLSDLSLVIHSDHDFFLYTLSDILKNLIAAVLRSSSSELTWALPVLNDLLRKVLKEVTMISILSLSFEYDVKRVTHFLFSFIHTLYAHHYVTGKVSTAEEICHSICNFIENKCHSPVHSKLYNFTSLNCFIDHGTAKIKSTTR